jgi:hypothetical protein
MTDIQFDRDIEHVPGFRADAVQGDTIFEVLVEPRDTRKLRAAFMDMARAATADWVAHVVLVLDSPHITQARLREEWEGARSVFKSTLHPKLSVTIRAESNWTGIPASPDAPQRSVLEQILARERDRRNPRMKGGSSAQYEILRLLMLQWLRGRGPTSTHWLMQMSGSSYPTVAKATRQLDDYLKRYPGGKVELDRFPRNPWARLLVVSDDVRSTVRFADRSGQPRTPESLLRRLHQIKRDDIAIGGIWGAKHYVPDLDIVGNSRLDLCLHSQRRKADYGFVKRLDPALEEIRTAGESASVVVHTLHRPESFFERSAEGPPWADPVECLLDLHEARLESQASEFVASFTKHGSTA